MSNLPQQNKSPLSRWMWIALVIASAIFPVLFPGHTPFISDEAQLLRFAYNANAAGHFANTGLIGTRGIRYGPFPIWVYQAILAITHNPIAIAAIHSALFSLSVTLGLIWLGRSLRLWRWGIFALLMSPYLWFYARELWDNTFNIPLGIACIAAYAAFVRHGRGWQLALAVFLSGIMLLVHLMAIVMPAALAIHLLIFHRKSLLANWPNVLIGLGLAGAASVGYLWNMGHEARGQNMMTAAEINRWWFALLGPRVLSGAWIDYFFPTDWLTNARTWSAFFAAARAVSLLAFPITWFGMLIGIDAMRSSPKRTTPATEIAAREIAVLCCIAVVLQILLNGLTVNYGHPHYYTATWAIFSVALWIGLDRLARFDWGKVIASLQPVAVSTMCVLLLCRLIRTHGTREIHFGPTLANKLQLLDDYAKYSEKSPMHLDVFMDPRTLRLLDLLYPHPRTGAEPTKDLAVKYASTNPYDGRLILVEDVP